ncbi:MAG: methyltransferase [Rikenellaceae bacterium]
MGSDLFKFKQFAVHQGHCAMKVGTDGVILGAWASIENNPVRILDVGTGTGLIALMLAQRAEGAEVDAVEIDKEAAREAYQNFEASPFHNRLQVFNADFQTFSKLRRVRYDLIVSNPPYFNGTYKSENAQRAAARHREALPFDDLIDGVLRVINRDGGRFVAIFPYIDAAVFIAKAASKGLYCNRILEVFPREGKSVKRFVGEFSLTQSAEAQIERLVVSGTDNLYTDDYKALTTNFYLRF